MGNYLRVRGEYRSEMTALIPCPELPPRARRIRARGSVGACNSGTTSACAENTGKIWRPVCAKRNYLRVRGEYAILAVISSHSSELPPRARRIHSGNPHPGAPGGTTSACAENTQQLFDRLHTLGNYLRVRGEYYEFAQENALQWELPPRARRILLLTLPCAIPKGTTSACAENTGP